MSGNMSIHHTYIFIDYFVLYFELSGFQGLRSTDIDDHDYNSGGVQRVPQGIHRNHSAAEKVILKLA